jgi:hypothetical protein
MASLGILEITEKTPSKTLLKNDKADKLLVISPYDSLDCVRITQFGKWCLDLITEKPAAAKNKYEAIADKELLLVTVKGDSLAITLYLDAIGSKLGANRWRISYASFIRGCETKEDIEERIETFKRLIDKTPSPQWEKLFTSALNFCGFFSASKIDAFVYSFNQNAEAMKDDTVSQMLDEIFRDPKLRGIAMRGEGGMLIVPVKNKTNFLNILREHGVLDKGVLDK